MRKLLIFVLLVATATAQEVFRITPQRPIEELRREALAAQPPQEQGKRKAELVELTTLDPTIKLDIRYATANNFLSTPVYEQARAFLQEPAAKALVKAHRRLKKQGYGLLIHDAYRPWYVTKIFWEATPPEQREFVADPASGSRHNRGAAVDLTLYDLKTGAAVEMPSLYDEFSPRAYPTYGGGTTEQRRLRDLLRAAMEKQGFKVVENEWWHFDYKDWREYPILNVAFAKLGAPYMPGEVVFESEASRENRIQPVNSAPSKGVPPGIKPPKAEYAPEPEYTPIAKKRNVEGTAYLSILIGEDGRVHRIMFHRGVGFGLDEEAVKVAQRWRFSPATRDGVPVAMWVNLEINFRYGFPE
jgi:D-alanyl-D-alanine dipeptidase